MSQFGVKDEFLIECQYYIDFYPDEPHVIDDPITYEPIGRVFFWVKDKNLFAFKNSEPEATYSADLTVLLEYFCEKLNVLLSDDPFPTKSIATNAIDMMEETKLIKGDDSDRSKWLEIDWEKVDKELYRKIDRWNVNHGLLTNRDGTFLPDLFIRKVEKQIEISWYNKYPHQSINGEVYFEHVKGVEYVDTKLFKDTIITFCLAVIDRLKKNRPEQMSRYLENLKKAMAIEV